MNILVKKGQIKDIRMQKIINEICDSKCLCKIIKIINYKTH